MVGTGRIGEPVGSAGDIKLPGVVQIEAEHKVVAALKTVRHCHRLAVVVRSGAADIFARKGVAERVELVGGIGQHGVALVLDIPYILVVGGVHSFPTQSVAAVVIPAVFAVIYVYECAVGGLDVVVTIGHGLACALAVDSIIGCIKLVEEGVELIVAHRSVIDSHKSVVESVEEGLVSLRIADIARVGAKLKLRLDVALNIVAESLQSAARVSVAGDNLAHIPHIGVLIAGQVCDVVRRILVGQIYTAPGVTIGIVGVQAEAGNLGNKSRVGVEEAHYNVGRHIPVGRE